MAHGPAGDRWCTQRGLTKTNAMEGAAHRGMGRERALSEEPGAQANAEAVTSYEGPLRADATGQAGPGAVPGRH